VPPLRSGVGLFASIAALKKVQRISAAIPHAHCGAFGSFFSCHAERIEASILEWCGDNTDHKGNS
jgi:hypothetical protein